jgi:hypothetical protein
MSAVGSQIFPMKMNMDIDWWIASMTSKDYSITWVSHPTPCWSRMTGVAQSDSESQEEILNDFLHWSQ